jgi:hypothetical protein
MSADGKYIMEAASELELEVDPAYVGRGLPDRACIAIRLTSFTQLGRIMFHLGSVNQDPEIQDMTELVFDWRYDSLGKNGWVLYWPHIKAPEQEDS